VRNRPHLVIVVLAILVGPLLASPAEAERRVALSIGIDVYDNLPADDQLQKAVGDARAVAAALRELGFETAVEPNPSRIDLMRAWQAFLNKVQPDDTAALFFAGHGVAIDGVNYLVPRDVPNVRASEERLLAGAGIRFDDMMHELRARKARMALFIIDACRNNPFRDTRGRSVGGARGLTRVADEVKGSFILYSAGYGEQALDRLSAADREANSPYTRTLIPILKTPGLSLPEIARRVRAQVVALARTAQPPHEQTPAYYDQVVGDFVLAPGALAAPPPAFVPTPQPAPQPAPLLPQIPAPEPRQLQPPTAELQAPIDNLFAAWSTLDVRRYIAQWAPDGFQLNHSDGKRRSRAELEASRERQFAQLQRVDTSYAARLREYRAGVAIFDVSYSLALIYKSGKRFKESACETYQVERRNGKWLVVVNDDYVQCR
jgi:caspase domain-containing protein